MQVALGRRDTQIVVKDIQESAEMETVALTYKRIMLRPIHLVVKIHLHLQATQYLPDVSGKQVVLINA